jgi:hypothetical protein
MTLLDRVCARLASHAIPHALIGAAALAARGIARSTFDIDLLVADRRALLEDLWQPLRATGASIDIRRGDADDPLGGVVRLEAPGERPVDVILGKHAWQARAVARAERAGDGPPVVVAQDLVLLKLYAGGTQDLWDVRELLSLDGTAELERAVAADLVDLPTQMAERWKDALD